MRMFQDRVLSGKYFYLDGRKMTLWGFMICTACHVSGGSS